MIGKSEWFGRRKYGGWGLTPKTWQGWAYIGAFILLVSATQSFPGLSLSIKNNIVYGLVALICIDVVHMMISVKKDELEIKMEAIAERNAAWGMVIVTVIAFMVQTIQSVITNQLAIDWYLPAIIAVGAVTKSITNYWYERKGM